MARFVLIHGSGSSAWHWHLVVPELEAAGHEGIAVELPADDPSAGLPEYVDAALAQAGDDAGGAIVVGHSLGAFTATWVADRLPASMLVLVAPMIPAPGETPREWGEHTDYGAAIAGLVEQYGPRAEWNLDTQNAVLLSDVPFGVRIKVPAHAKRQSPGPYSTPLQIDAWPAIPTHVLLCRDDLLFPAEFVRDLARERLGVEADEMDGGHTVMLSQPAELAQRLIAYAAAA